MARPRGMRHLDVFEAIWAFILENHYSPTLDELRTLTGIKSLSSMVAYLNRLSDDGMIERRRGVQRSIHITITTPVRSKILAERMDGRKHSSRAACAKKSAAGRKGKGVDALTSKRDPDLQKRIDAVVAKAKETEGNGMDVVRDYPRWNTLKASRVG